MMEVIPDRVQLVDWPPLRYRVYHLSGTVEVLHVDLVLPEPE